MYLHDWIDYQKHIIDNFVNSMHVYDDRLMMTYNYKDGTETISLDAVQQAFGSFFSSDAPFKTCRNAGLFCCFEWFLARDSVSKQHGLKNEKVLTRFSSPTQTKSEELFLTVHGRHYVFTVEGASN